VDTSIIEGLCGALYFGDFILDTILPQSLEGVGPSVCKSLIEAIPIPRSPTKSTPLLSKAVQLLCELLVVLELVHEH
jgi:hypothetical protein